MKNLAVLVVLLILCRLVPVSPVLAQGGPEFESVDEFVAALRAGVATEDQSQIDAFWSALTENVFIPFVMGNKVAFVYRGDARRVEWRGDFTNWDSTPAAQGERLGNSNIWLMVHEFPRDARLDYKIVVNGSTWLLDPLNPHQQVSGYGPNSEFAMPEYEYSHYIIFRDDIEHGTLSSAIAIDSAALGYKVNYRIYLPAGYNDMDNLPSIYVTDGHEYADPKMGSMINVLDNLIADGLITPVVAVFVDPRKPGTPGLNRRHTEYLENPAFATFLATELVPQIDNIYSTDTKSESRVILGTSMGGIAAIFQGLIYPDIFGNVAAQSPVLWLSSYIQPAWNETGWALPIFISSGHPEWDSDISGLDTFFETQGVRFDFIQVNEGHSWGQWRALLDEMLIFFFGEDSPTQ